MVQFIILPMTMPPAVILHGPLLIPPRGYADVVMNGTQPEVPLADTCLALPQNISGTLKKEENVNANESNSCSLHGYVNIGRRFYDKNILAAVIDN
ncbi:hypothetical protein VW25_004376 [Salmonella enterica subsp. enterica]|nr:hypothetical protein [Salmonella enterica subsp. enterica serovar Baguida]